MANDPVFNEGDKKKIKIVQPKAADPGFGCFLETEDGTSFDSSLEITVTVTDKNSQQKYTTIIKVMDSVCKNRLPLIAPFGDENSANQTGSGTPFDFHVAVKFCDPLNRDPYTSEATVSDLMSFGEFVILTGPVPLPPPPGVQGTAFSYIIKGLKILLGLDRA